ncbi:MAG: tRNA (N(6)-L-threonylcarbamoyladenosine(37)-C(2))-methylthiotransferase MtaB [Anaerolineales bacterium]|jgi:threonylcarbamoyladenosine tRNA methylthiotransferase MtaB
MIIYLDSVGCRLNQSEIEQFGRQLKSRGHQLTADPAHADLAVINTCAVTAKASSDSRAKARKLGESTRKGVVLTGCWSTLQPESAASMPNVHEVVKNEAKDSLVDRISPADPIDSELGMLGREPLPGLRKRTRAFIKVQDGCNLHCSYCVTTLARGKARSVPAAQVIDDIHYAERGGTQEVVLTGVHLGCWGQDLQYRSSLKELIREILAQTKIPRIRLSSLEPWDLDEDFFSLWKNPRLCRHLHLPLQSGSDRILRRMARRITTEEFATLVDTARSLIPDLAITTDVIVGFPGETQRDFEDGCTFIESLSLAGGHVFSYSERAGTPASRLKERIPTKIRKERSKILRHLLRESRKHFRQRQLGSKASVLWESIAGVTPQGYKLKGWTDNYIRVHHTGSPDLSNTITPIILKDIKPGRDTISVVLLEG